MNEPIILKNSFAMGLVAMLQIIAPALIAVSCLYTVFAAYGDRCKPYVHSMALVVGLLAAAVLASDADDAAAAAARVLPDCAGSGGALDGLARRSAGNRLCNAIFHVLFPTRGAHLGRLDARAHSGRDAGAVRADAAAAARSEEFSQDGDGQATRI